MPLQGSTIHHTVADSQAEDHHLPTHKIRKFVETTVSRVRIKAFRTLLYLFVVSPSLHDERSLPAIDFTEWHLISPAPLSDTRGRVCRLSRACACLCRGERRPDRSISTTHADDGRRRRKAFSPLCFDS